MARALEREDDDLGHVVGGHHPRQHLDRAAAAVVEREVGRDAARADVRAADAVLAQLVVERAREADLAELRGAVDGLERQPAPAGLRGERDHVALAAEHVRQRGAHRVERALEVHVDHLVEVLLREVEEGAVRADARVRDDDVDAAEALGGRVADRGQLRPGRARRTAARRRCRARGRRRVRDASPSFTPRWWSMRATAAPMPRLAPVITAVLPSSLMRPPEVSVPDTGRGSGRSRRAYDATHAGSGSMRASTRTQRATASAASAKTPARTPASSAAPNAEPASVAVRSSGRSSTEATIRVHSSLRAPPPASAADRRLARRARAAARASRAGRRRRPPSPPARARRGRAGARARRRRRGRRGRRAASARPRGTARTAAPPCPGCQRSASTSSSPTRRAEHVAQPAERAGGGEHHAHRVPRPGHRVAEDVHARLAVGRVGGQRREDDARGAEHDRDRPGPVDARHRAPPRPGRRRPRSPSTRTPSGSHSIGISSAAQTSSDQRRFATSKSSVPDASAASIARSPVSRKRT